MPKKKAVDVRVAGTPAEVAARLKKATRYAVQPSRGGPITWGNKPMKGQVNERGAALGLNRRDWFTLTQPTAQLAFEETPGGTRVHGVVGMPDWMTWMLRFLVVIWMPLVVSATVWMLLADGAPGTALIAPLFAGFATLATVGSIGWNVSHADGQVDDLEQTVLQWASTSGVPLDATTAALSESMREAAPGVRAGMDTLRDS